MRRFVRRHWMLSILVASVALGLAWWLAPWVGVILTIGCVVGVFVTAMPGVLTMDLRGPGYQYKDEKTPYEHVWWDDEKKEQRTRRA